eukprot:jgi/Psemu1/7763/gm1.7763_g
MHVKLKEKPVPLVNGHEELLGLETQHNHQTSIARFLKYNVNSQQEVHQQILMENIPYVFREIFVIDPEVIQVHTWVEKLILYSYLQEMGKIFTPLTEDLAGYMVGKSNDLLSANLEVVFLTKSDVNILGAEKDVLGREVDLTHAFKHLEGRDFKFHTRSIFKTWDCFKTSKGDIDSSTNHKYVHHLLNSGGKKPPANNSNESVSNSDNVTKTNHDKGNNPAGNNSKQSENGAKTGGANPLLVKKIEMAKKDGTRNDWEEKVSPNYSLNVNLPKFPLTVGRGFASHDIKVVLKEPDPEILYPIYRINQQVCYIGDQEQDQIGVIVSYVSDRYKDYDAYLGYQLHFQNEHCPMKRISDFVRCFSKKHGKHGELQGSDKSESHSDSTKVVSQFGSTTSSGRDEDDPPYSGLL